MICEYWCLIKRELLLFYRFRQDVVNSLLFFLVMVMLFPLTLGMDNQRLQAIAPGIIWMSALLASLLSMSQLFREDHRDGSLAQMLLSRKPLALMVFIKVCAHWLVFSLPLIVLSPLLALLFDFSGQVWLILVVSLLLGTPVLHLLGAFVASLSVGLRQANVLLALLLMPLFVPVLIFASHAVLAAQAGEAVIVPLLWLAALFVLALVLMPLLAAVALRNVY